MIKYITAGESHGKGLTVIVEGFPAGFPLSEDYIQEDLARRLPRAAVARADDRQRKCPPRTIRASGGGRGFDSAGGLRRTRSILHRLRLQPANVAACPIRSTPRCCPAESMGQAHAAR